MSESDPPAEDVKTETKAKRLTMRETLRRALEIKRAMGRLPETEKELQRLSAAQTEESKLSAAALASSRVARNRFYDVGLALEKHVEFTKNSVEVLCEKLRNATAQISATAETNVFRAIEKTIAPRVDGLEGRWQELVEAGKLNVLRGLELQDRQDDLIAVVDEQKRVNEIRGCNVDAMRTLVLQMRRDIAALKRAPKSPVKKKRKR